MQDRPTLKELIRGISTFLETDLMPLLQEPLRFHTRIAANLLRIIEREIDLEHGYLLEEVERLKKLLSKASPSGDSIAELRAEILKLNEELCTRIREGETDDEQRQRKIIYHIKQTLIEKLEITNPRMITKAQTRY